jgi:hypothetical protein
LPEPEKVELNDGLPDHSARPRPRRRACRSRSCSRQELALLNTASDVTHFAMEIGKRDDLDARARLRMSDA